MSDGYLCWFRFFKVKNAATSGIYKVMNVSEVNTQGQGQVLLYSDNQSFQLT